MKPTKPINVTGNPDWRYTSSAKTNLRATFAKARREQSAAKPVATNVSVLPKPVIRAKGK